MPLSDHEQRLLAQMESALRAEDPKFADNLRKPRRANLDRRGLALGIGAVLLGLGLLVGGVATQIIPLGMAGFVFMLGGAVLGYRAFSGGPEQPKASPDSPIRTKAVRKQAGSGFMNRLEDRWQQRKERGGR